MAFAPCPEGNEKFCPKSAKNSGSKVRGCDRARTSFIAATRQIMVKTEPNPSRIGRQERTWSARNTETVVSTGSATAREAIVSGQ